MALAGCKLFHWFIYAARSRWLYYWTRGSIESLVFYLKLYRANLQTLLQRTKRGPKIILRRVLIMVSLIIEFKPYIYSSRKFRIVVLEICNVRLLQKTNPLLLLPLLLLFNTSGHLNQNCVICGSLAIMASTRSTRACTLTWRQRSDISHQSRPHWRLDCSPICCLQP